jgi:hypothetical protein
MSERNKDPQTPPGPRDTPVKTAFVGALFGGLLGTCGGLVLAFVSQFFGHGYDVSAGTFALLAAFFGGAAAVGGFLVGLLLGLVGRWSAPPASRPRTHRRARRERARE